MATTADLYNNLVFIVYIVYMAYKNKNVFIVYIVYIVYRMAYKNKNILIASIVYRIREHWTTGNMQLACVNATSLRLGTKIKFGNNKLHSFNLIFLW